ncbi:MAG TPA: leucine-rich repeat domain-containing protein, partial [Phaeodactylibacter sp.]|nr:leucine-rich repeat domain-containing protein [Phaeodactylibacter sp.]
MKNILFFLLFFAFHSNAQKSFAEAISQGDQAVRKGDYQLAINKYFAAEDFDFSKKEIVRKKINTVFFKMENRIVQTDAALEKLDELRKETQTELLRANKIANTFPSYEGWFPLKRENAQSFYLDKNGGEIKKLGRWERAAYFDGRGFARVEKRVDGELQKYLLDLEGNTFRVAYKVEDLNPKITALDLSKQKLIEIPKAVFRQKQLKVLLLNDNKIGYIPNKLWDLQELSVLDLSGTALTKLPSKIANLQNLSNLNLSRTRLARLPEGLWRLKKLTKLDLSFLMLKTLPAEIETLQNLVQLNLTLNQLETLPTELWTLKNLSHLNLSKNKLTKISPEIKHLQNLKVLALFENELTTLPPEIGDLKKLDKLHVGWNYLENFPERICNLKNLSHLNLSKNKLTKISPEIKHLQNLKV